MRSAEEIFNLILRIAKPDKRVRAVLLNGSRADPTVKEDKFQDFDIVYLVTEMGSFLADHSWINIFGDRRILQMPREMTIENEKNFSFPYLMLFLDDNRVDLTLFPIDQFKKQFKSDSLTIPLLDKDQLFTNLPAASNQDYLIKRPVEKEFIDCCNEFWWVSTYVAKGLCRNQITYAKEMLEVPLRKMFFKILEWHIGILHEFSVSFGKGGKFMKDYLPPFLYEKVLSTYPDAAAGNIWKSFLMMTKLFSEFAAGIAISFQFDYNSMEEQNVVDYLNTVYQMSIEK